MTRIPPSRRTVSRISRQATARTRRVTARTTSRSEMAVARMMIQAAMAAARMMMPTVADNSKDKEVAWGGQHQRGGGGGGGRQCQRCQGGQRQATASRMRWEEDVGNDKEVGGNGDGREYEAR